MLGFEWHPALAARIRSQRSGLSDADLLDVPPGRKRTPEISRNRKRKRIKLLLRELCCCDLRAAGANQTMDVDRQRGLLAAYTNPDWYEPEHDRNGYEDDSQSGCITWESGFGHKLFRAARIGAARQLLSSSPSWPASARGLVGRLVESA